MQERDIKLQLLRSDVGLLRPRKALLPIFKNYANLKDGNVAELFLTGDGKDLTPNDKNYDAILNSISALMKSSYGRDCIDNDLVWSMCVDVADDRRTIAIYPRSLKVEYFLNELQDLHKQVDTALQPLLIKRL